MILLGHSQTVIEILQLIRSWCDDQDFGRVMAATRETSRFGHGTPPQVEAKREWRPCFCMFCVTLRRENIFFRTRDAPTVGDVVQFSWGTWRRPSPRQSFSANLASTTPPTLNTARTKTLLQTSTVGALGRGSANGDSHEGHEKRSPKIRVDRRNDQQHAFPHPAQSQGHRQPPNCSPEADHSHGYVLVSLYLTLQLTDLLPLMAR